MLRGFSGVCFLIIAEVCVATCFSTRARAWDQHHVITRKSLEAYATSAPKRFEQLITPVEVRPIEQFIERAFGASCELTRFRDNVLEGVGKNFRFHYVEGAQARILTDWENGTATNVLHYLPTPPAHNSQAIGEWVRPIDVISIYSDEPDWQMDDDVPRLKDVGYAKGESGVGSRILRHFWFKGQLPYGVDLSVGQELDRRMELFHQLALVAFAVGEPYWAYRFLGNALHYVQDITQPFHIRVEMANRMIYRLKLARAFLCATSSRLDPTAPPSENCPPDLTIENYVRKSAQLNTVYHSLYESFSRALIERNLFNSVRYLTEAAPLFVTPPPAEPEELLRRSSSGLIDGTGSANLIQSEILKISEPVGDLVVDFFGTRYRNDMKASEAAILLAGTETSVGYLAGYVGYQQLPFESRKQAQAREPLVTQTELLLFRAARFSRALTTLTLELSETPLPEIDRLHALFTSSCVLPLN